MKILILLVSLSLSLNTFSGVISKECKDVLKEDVAWNVAGVVGTTAGLIGGVVGAVFTGGVLAPLAGVGGGALIYTSVKLHKSRRVYQTFADLDSDTKPTRYSKGLLKLAEEVGMTGDELWQHAQKNPLHFCSSSGMPRKYDKIIVLLGMEKAKPLIQKVLSDCSPENTRKKLGVTAPRFNQPVSEKQAQDAIQNGISILNGGKLKGLENRPSYFYSSENGFTDPLFFNREKYQFFVHVIRNSHNEGTHNYILNWFDEYFSSLKKISVSMVDEKDTVPFDNGIGLLLKFDPKNVISAYGRNMSSDYMKTLLAINQNYPLIPSSHVLKSRANYKTLNNEVVVLKKTDVIGFWILGHEHSNQPLYEYYPVKKMEILHKACMKYNLPVVLLKRYNSKKFGEVF